MKSFLFILFAIVIEAKLIQKSLISFIDNKNDILDSPKKSLEEQVYETWGSESLDHLSTWTI